MSVSDSARLQECRLLNRSLEFYLVWVRIRIIIGETFSIYDDEGNASKEDQRFHDNNSDNHCS